MDKLSLLAARCEAATGPDKLIDAEIALALGIGPKGGPLPVDAELYLAHYPNAHITREGQYYGYLWGRSHADPTDTFGWHAVRFTASLDVAMMLVPEGCCGQLQFGKHTGAWIAPLADEHPADFNVCATPALALCAAALRARVTLSGSSSVKS